MEENAFMGMEDFLIKLKKTLFLIKMRMGRYFLKAYGTLPFKPIDNSIFIGTKYKHYC